MIQIVYTHSNCSDLWELFIKQNKKHFGFPLFFITNKKIPDFPNENQYIYNDNDEYYQVWLKALENINHDFFIYLQEDFILYDDVNINKLNEYKLILEKSDYSFVRLIKSGEVNNRYNNTLFEISSNNPYIFAMQTTIWKKNKYIEILKNVKEPKWLETPNYRNYMEKENIFGLCHYDNEKKRGGNHWDSNVYPYIATALVKGKWILSEYSNELLLLLNENKIDVNIRGYI